MALHAFTGYDTGMTICDAFICIARASPGFVPGVSFVFSLDGHY